MRLSAVFHLGDVSGPARTLAPRLEFLAGRHEVEVVFPRRGTAACAYEPFAEVSLLPYEPLAFPSSARGYGAAALALLRDAVRFREHFSRRATSLAIVVSTVIPAALLGARLARIPAVVYAAELADRGYAGGWLRAAASASNIGLTRALASAIVGCSRAVARQFSPSGPKISTIYPGIAPHSLVGDAGRFRRELGFSSGQPVVALVGNLSSGRGQDLVVRALPAIRTSRPDAVCIIAGASLPNERDAAFRTELEDLVAKLGLQGAVHFLGFVPDVADVYAAANVVVNGARVNEAFGRVALEALAAGRPVVASRVGAIPEVLRDGVDALLVERGSPEAIAEAVLRILGDQALAERLVAAGSARVLSEFDERRGVAAFAEVIERALRD